MPLPDHVREAIERGRVVAGVDMLVRVLQARYNIPSERIYAHNWIDFKDARYCEGCELAKLAREWGE